MSHTLSQGVKFRQAMESEKPLQIVGTINAYTALQAKHAGFKAIYLSGAGVANASLGVPDLGITTLNDVLEDVRRISGAVDLPLLVDIDTGWGNAFSIARAIKEMIRAGAAAVHIEDQIQAKRCGHRQGKELVSATEMSDRIKAAVEAKTDADFVIMARTDALASEGMNSTLDRICQYVDAGADMIFLEGANKITDYETVTRNINVPVLANITEFGVTPLFTVEELKNAGVNIILYPLSEFRAMSAAVTKVYDTIRHTGTQQAVIDQMQTREELYDILNYHSYEDKLNALLKKEKG